MKRFMNVLLVVGAGMLVYGLTSWHGRGGIDGVRSAGWTPDGQLDMAVGAMLLVIGLVFRERD